MASYNISYIYSIKDRYSAQAAKIKANTVAVSKSFDKLGARAAAASAKMNGIGKSMTLKVTAPIIAIGTAAVIAAAKMETLAVQLNSMTGSAEVGGKLLKDLLEFSASTPFQIAGLGASAKQLLAAGVGVDEIKDKLKFLGDIAAGTGRPIENITSIFAKLKGRGKASMEELNQLMEAGSPILDVLAKGFNVAKEDVMKMASQGKISFAVMQDAMRSMTEEGGIFNDQMAKQSETLGGLWSTLTDNVGLFLAELGTAIVDTVDLRKVLVNVIDAIKGMTNGIASFAKEHPTLLKIGVIFLGMLAVVGPMLVGLATLAPLIMGVIPAVVALSGFLLPVLAVVTAITAAFGAVGAAIFQLQKNWDVLFSGGMLETLKAFGGFLGEGLTSLFSPDDVNINKSITQTSIASQEVVSKNSLNGTILVQAEQGTTVKNVSSVSNGEASLDLGYGYGGLG